MKKNIFIIVCVFYMNLIYCQDCNKFAEGIFKNDGIGNITVERKDNYQLEKSEDFKTIYLQKIEPISECEYILKRYKVISEGILPFPNMEEIVKVQIYKVEDKKFFYHAKLIGTELSKDGMFIKISEKIDKEFSDILLKEN